MVRVVRWQSEQKSGCLKPKIRHALDRDFRTLRGHALPLCATLTGTLAGLGESNGLCSVDGCSSRLFDVSRSKGDMPSEPCTLARRSCPFHSVEYEICNENNGLQIQEAENRESESRHRRRIDACDSPIPLRVPSTATKRVLQAAPAFLLRDFTSIFWRGPLRKSVSYQLRTRNRNHPNGFNPPVWETARP